MSKFKIGAFADNRPVAVTMRLPAPVYRDLTAYAELLKQEASQPSIQNSLIAPMLEQFMATSCVAKLLKRKVGNVLSRASETWREQRFRSLDARKPKTARGRAPFHPLTP
jgi:hypothetical protein